MMKTSRIGLLVAVLLLAASSASAEEGLAVVLEPGVDGALTKEERTRLSLAVHEALRGVQLEAVPLADLEAIESGEADLKGCLTDDCMERIGRLLSAQIVLGQTLQARRLPPPQPAPPRSEAQPEIARSTWQLRTTLFNVGVGAIGAQGTVGCDACTLEQAASKLSELVKQTILLDAARPRGKIEVTSTPGADVVVDGRKLGFTPYKREAFAGRHGVSVVRAGYRSLHRSLWVEDGQKASLSVTLEVGSDAPVVSPKEILGRKRRLVVRAVLGPVGVAGGVTMIGFGALALSLDGTSITRTTGGTRTLLTYETRGPGLALVTAGSVAVIGTILAVLPWELWLGSKKAPPVSVSAGAARDGLSLSLSGSF